MPNKAAPASQETTQGWFAELVRIFATLCAHFFTLLLLFFVFVKIVPACIVWFEEFDTALPHATQLVITLSNLAVIYWYLIFPFVLLVDTVLVVLLRLTKVTRLWLLPLWCNLWYLGVIFLLFVVTTALYMPFAQMTQNP